MSSPTGLRGTERPYKAIDSDVNWRDMTYSADSTVEATNRLTMNRVATMYRVAYDYAFIRQEHWESASPNEFLR